MRTTIVLVLLGVGGCVWPADKDDANSIPIGAVLPFTGDIAAAGTNIERALIMTAEQINAAGTINGNTVRIISADSHSEIKRGIAVTRQLIDDEHILALLGPEHEDLAVRLLPMIRDKKIVEISGGVTSTTFSTADDDGLWFRTSPSAQVYGKQLAEQMAKDKVKRAAILYVADEYGTGIAAVMSNEFTTLGIQAPAPTSFRPGMATYTSLLNKLLASDPDAIVLIAYPRSGATIIQEWAILGGDNRWYFGPKLKADVFIANVPPGLLNGAIGLTASVAADATRFSQAFAARWSGDRPLDVAYFYYDAAALLTLAIAGAAHKAKGTPSAEQVRDEIIPIASPDGQEVAWHELGRALKLVQQGKAINYRGASGPVDLDGHGDLSTSKVNFWTIKDDKIVPYSG